MTNDHYFWFSLPLSLGAIFLGLTVVWWRPIVTYPFFLVFSFLLYRADEKRSSDHISLLHWHPAFWDEYQNFPLIGLEDHLVLVTERSPVEGQVAIQYLATSPQRWAAQAAQIELDVRRLECCADIITIGQVYRDLAIGGLTGPANALFQTFSRCSKDVEAALRQITGYHQRLALSAVDDRLNKLGRELTLSSEPYAIRFYPVTIQWYQTITKHISQLTKAIELNQEIDNPYVFGIPLAEQNELFTGRLDIVARIEQMLLDPRRPPLLLYGQRRMGKTSLLHNLGRLMPSTIVPFFVDGEGITGASDYPELLHSIAREMVSSAESRGFPLSNPDLGDLRNSPFVSFNNWLDKIERELDAYTQGKGLALLMLDEFEALSSVSNKGRFDERDLLRLLRHLIQHRPRFKLLLAGSYTLTEMRQWAGYLINIQVIKIGLLKRKEAQGLIEDPVKGFVLHYKATATERILALTQGHPHLVQLLCHEIVILKNTQDPTTRRLATLGDVEAAVLKALESGSFFFVDIEVNQVNKAGLVLLRLVADQGEGAIVERDTLYTQLPEAEELDSLLDQLLQRDLICRADDGYRFQVELIRRWFAR